MTIAARLLLLLLPLPPAAGMPKLSKEAKQRLQQLFKGGQFAIRWGFIPVVLYLGQWRRGRRPPAGLRRPATERGLPWAAPASGLGGCGQGARGPPG